MISKRTKEGLAAARKRGVQLGRRPKLSPDQVRQARDKLDAGTHTQAKLAAKFGVHPRTLARALKRKLHN